MRNRCDSLPKWVLELERPAFAVFLPLVAGEPPVPWGVDDVCLSDGPLHQADQTEADCHLEVAPRPLDLFTEIGEAAASRRARTTLTFVRARLSSSSLPSS